jgi:hypothetical protein
VIRCVEARSYAWYRRLGSSVSTLGGAGMLVGAALAGLSHHATSVPPLLVFGGGWLALGVAALISNQRFAREIVIDGSQVHFISPGKQVVIGAADILEIGHTRWDPNRMGALLIRTSTHGTIRTVGRLTGLIDVLVELRRLNPNVIYRNI